MAPMALSQVCGSARLWAEARRSEGRLLQMALGPRPFCVVDPATPVTARPEDTVNSVVIEGSTRGGREVVLIHGFSCGAGIFFRNLAALAGGPGIGRVSSIDWRGAGLSGRALPYEPRNHDEAVDFFVAGVEAWRAANPQHPEAKNKEKFVLVGHSMGALIAAHYAARHPDRIEHLVLCGPAGVGRAQEPPERFKDSSVYQLAVSLWDCGLTPGSVIRALGPLGKGFIGRYVDRRFREGDALDPPEAEALGDYLHAILALPGCSEKAMSQILAPIAQARQPLAPLVEGLQGYPVTYVYGASDWMNPNAGLESARRMVASGKDAQCIIIPNAGHYAFLDQPRTFNDLLLRRITDGTNP